jgi:hypothetical protein
VKQCSCEDETARRYKKHVKTISTPGVFTHYDYADATTVIHFKISNPTIICYGSFYRPERAVATLMKEATDDQK